MRLPISEQGYWQTVMGSPVELRHQAPRHRLMRAAVIAAFAVASVAALSVPARAGDPLWYMNFETYLDHVGGLPTDLSLIMGVRADALDDYDLFDWPKPLPPPGSL